MLFNSLNFILFFLIFFTFYWNVKKKNRYIFILLGSCFFYGYWSQYFLLLLLISSSLDYYLAIKLTSSKKKSLKKIGLWISLILNFGVLIYFKYSLFFLESVYSIFKLNSSGLDKFETIVLPIGISFYTFQIVSYSIDIYRCTIRPEKNYLKFISFVTFFPQLIAGPIERAKNLLPQINGENKNLSFEIIYNGLKLFLWGLFLKVVIADNLAILVDAKYSNLQNESGGAIFFAIILFSFQLYCDFNGYSKMALGLAKMLGYELSNNFNYPFISRSFKEFWSRWHISLSLWFRDYVYIPLGGKNNHNFKFYTVIFITFFISGLWHGASINFVLWGILCAIIFILENLARKFILNYIKWWKKITLFRIFLVFGLFTLTLIPFRANNEKDIIIIVYKLLDVNFKDVYFWFADNRFQPGMIGLYLLILIEFWFGLNINNYINLKNNIVSYLFYTLLFFIIILFGNDAGSQFIYFQF